MSETKKVALVTGASGGLGAALAVDLAELDYDLVLVGRNQEKLDATAEAVKAAKGDTEVMIRPTDLGVVDQVESLMDEVKEKFGRLDLLANVAGKAMLKEISKITTEDWQSMVDANLSPVIHTTRLAWPLFKQQKSGFVINISSMASKDPFPGFAVYATVKCGVNMFTLMTGREGKRIGVKAICIAPGAVETDMLRGMFNEKMIPRDAALSPEELADLICECVTGQREFESGQTLFVSK